MYRDLAIVRSAEIRNMHDVLVWFPGTMEPLGWSNVEASERAALQGEKPWMRRI